MLAAALSAILLSTDMQLGSAALAASAQPIEQEQTAASQNSKSAPLSQTEQSAATDASSELPPLPTTFPLLPDVAVQAPQQVLPSILRLMVSCCLS